MVEKTLTLRALNRATLARQLLLAREKTKAVAAVERLVGLQAQLARPPYVGLWSRVEGFRREELTKAIRERAVVRATLMRGTLHLFGAADYRRLRMTLQPMLDKGLRSVLRDRVEGLDVAALCADAKAFLVQPHTFDEVRDHLIASRPGGDERALGYVVRCALPLVQAPDASSAWGYHGRADFVSAEAWLGAPVDAAPDAAALVRRYLAAFGPATAADAQTWSGLAPLKETFEALRPELAVFRDDRGRELFDLRDAPRPAEETPAPVRFLPEYDNLLLGHDDRRRIVADTHRAVLCTPNLQILATFLVDGFAAGTWKAERKKKTATLEAKPFGKLAKRVRAELEREGEELLAFTDPDATAREVRFVEL